MNVYEGTGVSVECRKGKGKGNGAYIRDLGYMGGRVKYRDGL